MNGNGGDGIRLCGWLKLINFKKRKITIKYVYIFRNEYINIYIYSHDVGKGILKMDLF